MEFPMLASISSLSDPANAFGLLPSILQSDTPPNPAAAASSKNDPFANLPCCTDVVEAAQQQVKAEFGLNEDQAKVLDACAAWFARPADPVVLVHGTFGSGKSFLLGALIIFLCRVLDKVDKKGSVRILVAAQTNVAVDGVLMGLLKRGFEAFARVGSVKKIAKPVLKHVLHYSPAAKSQVQHDAAALKELQEMLAQARNT
eukprot:CAMPEP_0175178676 /NCGR_PEP_ID=MMETSP0087-20121206/35100_1 /TAXON_ID=136419 /ORGANISM="Unknown Unknown, Strain D1" /LENGTH=200 /DNA_ID=CAMNT_0016470843 /DNA_START=41 /DNA_END=639 /DNA_ORIENTATION=-